MKSVLRSIKPYWLYLILIGKKKIEVGKTFPQSEDWNRLVYLYCSKDKKSFNRIPKKDQEWMQEYLGKVACQFVCNNSTYIDARIDVFGNKHLGNVAFLQKWMCLSDDELFDYLYKGKNKNNGGWAWHISKLVEYIGLPKELGEFTLARHCFNTKNLETVENCMGDYVTKYYNNSFCRQCKYYDSDCNWCDKTDTERPVTRPPQSWCYVEDLGV